MQKDRIFFDMTQEEKRKKKETRNKTQERQKKQARTEFF